MAQAGFSFIAIILAAITGIISHPPEDLLSLADTKQLLVQLKVEQSEEALIAILKGKESVQTDTSSLDAAVKKLREGSFKERKAARKILNAAGEEHKAYFEKIKNDSDPEVSETAKNILKKFKDQKQASQKSGLTNDVKKLIAIRRLTEMQSTKALPVIESLLNDENKDLAFEAARAKALLLGKKPERPSRNEATQKLLKMLPADGGFYLALDMTEPDKKMNLAAYLTSLKKVPGMDLAKVTGMFHQSLPQVLSKVGNPRIDGIVMISHSQLGVKRDDSWMGFIAKGQYNSKKIKAFLAGEKLQEMKHNGITYWSERWGPSICPVNDEIMILSVGDNGSNHMVKMIDGYKASANNVNLSTSTSRLVGEGALSKEQKETLREEVDRELVRIQGRNRPDSNAEKAMLNLAKLTTVVKYFKAEYGEDIITVNCEMEKEADTKKLVDAVTEADKEIRNMFKMFPFPAFKALDLEKRFSRTSVDGSVVKVQIKSEFFNTMSLMPMMMFARVAQPMPADVEVIMEDVEGVEIEQAPVIIEE